MIPIRGAEVEGKLASTPIITCIHIYAVAGRRRSGSKICSATNGSNSQLFAFASKPRAPSHHCPQQMSDPPPHMCEHTRGGRVGMSKSTHFCSATAPRICEHSLTQNPCANRLTVKWSLWCFLRWEVNPQCVISVSLGQYHSCWCPVSLRRQDTSSHDIDYVEWVGPCLMWGRISTTVSYQCRGMTWNVNIYFMFPQKKWAHKGLNNWDNSRFDVEIRCATTYDLLLC